MLHRDLASSLRGFYIDEREVWAKAELKCEDLTSRSPSEHVSLLTHKDSRLTRLLNRVIELPNYLLDKSDHPYSLDFFFICSCTELSNFVYVRIVYIGAC